MGDYLIPAHAATTKARFPCDTAGVVTRFAQDLRISLHGSDPFDVRWRCRVGFTPFFRRVNAPPRARVRRRAGGRAPPQGFRLRSPVPSAASLDAAIALSVTGDNLLDQPVTLLPPEPEVLVALSRTGRHEIATVVAAHPTSSLAWAELADITHAEGRSLESYAYARVGYHRGLDALRKAGWRGHGSIPWGHEPNRGVLRALFALRRAAAEIGEMDEFERLTTFLADADPTAIGRIGSEHTATQLIRVITPITAEPGAEPATSPAPPTEAFVIRGED